MDPYELLGRLYADHNHMQREYANLLELLSRIQRGEVRIEHIAILPGNAWEIRIPVSEIIGTVGREEDR